ncbi:HNH endonuclease protein [Rhizobium phage RHph_N1_15]|nr:HNH endonuclease protein [Rhizobium phage RHph_N1_15]QIG75190.1 HNH endonuclease protein [Rhizobium phage RHph_N2_6]
MTTQREQMELKDARVIALLASGRYSVDDDGNIHSHRYLVKKKIWKSFIMKVRRIPGKDYCALSLCDSQGIMTVFVHRIVALAKHPNPLGLPEVNHKDGVKWHNHPDNLEWSTSADNTDHAVKTGLRDNRATGSRLPQSVITEADVSVIKQRLRAGDLQKVIALDFGITQPTVSAIKSGLTWKEVA